MTQLRYTRDHEWVRIEGPVATVGITDHAQDQLGDIVFVELPDRGRTVSAGEEIAVVESVKTAAEVYAPLSGEVVDINRDLEDAPGTVNEDAAGGGWMVQIRMSDPGEQESLLDEDAYRALVEGD